MFAAAGFFDFLDNHCTCYVLSGVSVYIDQSALVCLWGWCGIEVSSVRSHIQAHAVMWRALSRDNHEAMQVQLPPVLFFFCDTHIHTHPFIDGNVKPKHMIAAYKSTLWSWGGGDNPLPPHSHSYSESPRIEESLQNKHHRQHVDCLLEMSRVMLYLNGNMEAMADCGWQGLEHNVKREVT